MLQPLLRYISHALQENIGGFRLQQTRYIRRHFCFFFFSSRRRHTRLQGDWSSDVCSSDLAAHNRSVFTFVAPPDASVEAALAAMRVATERIDLSRHTGEHPRMGATDVVPFEIGRASCRERV